MIYQSDSKCIKGVQSHLYNHMISTCLNHKSHGFVALEAKGDPKDGNLLWKEKQSGKDTTERQMGSLYVYVDINQLSTIWY